MKVSELQKAAGKKRARRPDPAAQARSLWLAITRRSWHTLAVLPAHEGGSALSLAYELVEAGNILRRRPVELISAEGLDLTAASGWLFEAVSGRIGPRALEANAGTVVPEPFGRVVVLESVASNMLSVPVAQAADACLLVVEQGVSDLSSARATLKAVGRERFVGSAIISAEARR